MENFHSEQGEEMNKTKQNGLECRETGLLKQIKKKEQQ